MLQQQQKTIETVLITTQKELTYHKQIKGLIVSKALMNILETHIIGPL